jgi:hypothetical protein
VIPIFEAVNIPFVQQFLEDGMLRPNDVMESALTAMLDELLRYTEATEVLRGRSREG